MEQRNELRVKYLQCHIQWEDEQANLQHYTSLIESSIGECDLFVLPEMFHCGFTEHPERVAQSMDGSVVQWMKQMAVKHATAVVGSVVVAEGSAFFNRLIFVYPNGAMTWYDKRHLFRMGNEHHRFDSGERRLVIQYKGWRILPLVCYDLRFPVWARNNNDYDLMLIVANWPSSRREVWNVLLKARAIENQCYVLAVNRVGEDPLNHYSGDSVVIDARGHLLSSVAEGEESLQGCEIDLLMLQKFRSKFPAFMDRDRFNII